MAFTSILDPQFKYRNAVSTDVRLTFERIRGEQGRPRPQVARASFKVVGPIRHKRADAPAILNLVRRIDVDFRASPPLLEQAG